MLQLDLALQQPSQLHIVVVGQQVLRFCFLRFPPRLLQLLVGFCDLFRRHRCLRRRVCLCRTLVSIAFHSAQVSNGVSDGSIKVILRPALELLRIPSIVFAQGFLRFFDALRHFKHAHQLVSRMRQIIREQLRCHVLQLLIRHIHRQPALVDDSQPPEGALSEVIEVRNVVLVLLRYGHSLRAKVIFDVLILLVELLIHHNALAVCLLKQLRRRLFRNVPGGQVLLADLLRDLLQVFPLCKARHAQRAAYAPNKGVFSPLQVVLCLLRQRCTDAVLLLFVLRRRQRRLRRFLLCDGILQRPFISWHSETLHHRIAVFIAQRQQVMHPHLRVRPCATEVLPGQRQLSDLALGILVGGIEQQHRDLFHACIPHGHRAVPPLMSLYLSCFVVDVQLDRLPPCGFAQFLRVQFLAVLLHDLPSALAGGQVQEVIRCHVGNVRLRILRAALCCIVSQVGVNGAFLQFDRSVILSAFADREPDVRIVCRVFVGDALDLFRGEGDVYRVRRSVVVHLDVSGLYDDTVMPAFLRPALQVSVPDVCLSDCTAPAFVLNDKRVFQVQINLHDFPLALVAGRLSCIPGCILNVWAKVKSEITASVCKVFPDVCLIEDRKLCSGSMVERQQPSLAIHRFAVLEELLLCFRQLPAVTVLADGELHPLQPVHQRLPLFVVAGLVLYDVHARGRLHRCDLFRRCAGWRDDGRRLAEGDYSLRLRLVVSRRDVGCAVNERKDALGVPVGYGITFLAERRLHRRHGFLPLGRFCDDAAQVLLLLEAVVVLVHRGEHQIVHHTVKIDAEVSQRLLVFLFAHRAQSRLVRVHLVHVPIFPRGRCRQCLRCHAVHVRALGCRHVHGLHDVLRRVVPVCLCKAASAAVGHCILAVVDAPLAQQPLQLWLHPVFHRPQRIVPASARCDHLHHLGRRGFLVDLARASAALIELLRAPDEVLHPVREHIVLHVVVDALLLGFRSAVQEVGVFLCIDLPDGLFRRFHLFRRQALAGHQLHRQPRHFLFAHRVEVPLNGCVAEETVELLVTVHRFKALALALKECRLHLRMVRQLVGDLFQLPSGLILQSDLAQRAAALENAARKLAGQVLDVLIERPPRLVVHLALHQRIVLCRCPCVAAVHLVTRVCLRVYGGTWEHYAGISVLRVPLRRVHDGHGRGWDAAPVQGRVTNNRPVLVVYGNQVFRPLHRLVDGEALLDRRQLLCYTIVRGGCSASGSSR